MRKGRAMSQLTIGYLAVAVAVTFVGVEAAPTDQTVRELLQACASHDPSVVNTKCDRQMGPMFEGAVMAAMSHSDQRDKLCLPLANSTVETYNTYKVGVLQWLRDHPKTRTYSVSKGVRLATEALYKCKGT